ncbi:MAG: histidinol-phosphatase [Chloroflexi bacterium]|nr:histidinol-phosphatase [Chloroflexota bacterium]
MADRPAPDDVAAFRPLAEALADAAGAAIRPHFRRRLAVEAKADASPVTVAARAAESAMRELLAARRPGDGVVGEEYGAERAGAEYVWVLDPIDGTKAFISGLPTFGTLIALLRRGTPVLGVIDQPVSGERWLGVAGRGADLRDGRDAVPRPIRTRACASLGEASLFCTHPDQFAGADAEAWARLAARAGLTRHGLDCYAYAMLATGFVDLAVEATLEPYDYLALVPVIEAAGGRISDWDGAPLGLASDGRVVAAGDPRRHSEALAVLRGSG